MNTKYVLALILTAAVVVFIGFAAIDADSDAGVTSEVATSSVEAIEDADTEEDGAEDSEDDTGEITAPESGEEPTENDPAEDDSAVQGNPDNQEVGLAQACTEAGGNWLDKFSECENVQPSWCERYDGNYQSCASACRNNPDARVCTHQCVAVCNFMR